MKDTHVKNPAQGLDDRCLIRLFWQFKGSQESLHKRLVLSDETPNLHSPLVTLNLWLFEEAQIFHPLSVLGWRKLTGCIERWHFSLLTND